MTQMRRILTHLFSLLFILAVTFQAMTAQGDSQTQSKPNAAQSSGLFRLAMLPNDKMNPLFEATVQAVEEAIINALVAAETMVGRDDHKVVALPQDGVREVLKKYNRPTWPRK